MILGFSLWTGRYVELRTQHWTTLLEETGEAARQEDWGEAADRLERAYEDSAPWPTISAPTAAP